MTKSMDIARAFNCQFVSSIPRQSKCSRQNRTYQRRSLGNQNFHRPRQPNLRLISTKISCLFEREARRAETENSQNVRLMIMFAGPNWPLMSHWVFGKNANGVPQLSVSTALAPFNTSEGMPTASRGQNQILMNAEVRSIAYL